MSDDSIDVKKTFPGWRTRLFNGNIIFAIFRELKVLPGEVDSCDAMANELNKYLCALGIDRDTPEKLKTLEAYAEKQFNTVCVFEEKIFQQSKRIIELERQLGAQKELNKYESGIGSRPMGAGE